VGLVAFSTGARIVVEPTTDRARVLDAIGSLRAEAGTALGDAIALSVEAATIGTSAANPGPSPGTSPGASPGSGAEPADPDADLEAPVVATVLLSDGANSTGELEPVEAAERAASAGVPVYTIALGTDRGIVDVPTGDGRVEPLPVPPDPETLATVAELTGGRFFEAPTADDLAAIYESLGSRVGFVEEEQEVTQLFAAGGLLLVLVGAGLAAHWFNRFP
jgi:Ca-activated chloride channel family protein